METLFFNGLIYTSNPLQSFANAMLVKDGKIVWVGDFEDIDRTERQCIDLKGKRVLPGFVDSHMHPLLLAEAEEQIYCGPPSVYSIEELKQAIRAKYLSLKESNRNEWIKCWGYDEAKFQERRAPSRWDLDQVAPDIPVMITRACAHVIVVNSCALRLAGVDYYTETPSGGEIDRDTSGELTGVLRENARDLIYKIIPEVSLLEKSQLLSRLSSKLFSKGITATTDLMARTDPYDNMEIYNLAVKLGYKQRTVLYYLWEDLKSVERIPTSVLDRTKQLHVGGVKLFADGSVSGRTAWVEEPYEGYENNRGLSMTTKEELIEAAEFAKEHEIQLVVHAMGERAINQIVDTFYPSENWIADAPSIRIEHAALPTVETLKRAVESRFGIVSQPIFLYAEIESYYSNLGVERTHRSYPYRTMLELGACLSFSSDAPATSWNDTSNPFTGIKAAVTRKSYIGRDFNLDQQIGVEEAIALYTRCSQEMTRIPLVGQLKPGYWADFIILDKDIFTINPEEIDQIKVLKTYFNGEEVYSTECN